MTICPKCGRKRASDVDDAFAHPTRCSAGLAGGNDDMCQRVNGLATKAAAAALLRNHFRDQTIRVLSTRITRPGVLLVKAHRSCPTELIEVELHLDQVALR